MIVVWLFLAVPSPCLQFVIVVFPEHTPLLFLTARISHMKRSKKYTHSNKFINERLIVAPFLNIFYESYIQFGL